MGFADASQRWKDKNNLELTDCYGPGHAQQMFRKILNFRRLLACRDGHEGQRQAHCRSDVVRSGLLRASPHRKPAGRRGGRHAATMSNALQQPCLPCLRCTVLGFRWSQPWHCGRSRCSTLQEQLCSWKVQNSCQFSKARIVVFSASSQASLGNQASNSIRCSLNVWPVGQSPEHCRKHASRCIVNIPGSYTPQVPSDSFQMWCPTSPRHQIPTRII